MNGVLNELIQIMCKNLQIAYEFNMELESGGTLISGCLEGVWKKARLDPCGNDQCDEFQIKECGISRITDKNWACL